MKASDLNSDQREILLNAMRQSYGEEAVRQMLRQVGEDQMLDAQLAILQQDQNLSQMISSRPSSTSISASTSRSVSSSKNSSKRLPNPLAESIEIALPIALQISFIIPFLVAVLLASTWQWLISQSTTNQAELDQVANSCIWITVIPLSILWLIVLMSAPEGRELLAISVFIFVFVFVFVFFSNVIRIITRPFRRHAP